MDDPFYNLYNIIFDTAKNINFNLTYQYYDELGGNNPQLLHWPANIQNTHEDGYKQLLKSQIIFHDQEPILFNHFKNDWINIIARYNKLQTNHLVSNSEKNSPDKDALLEASGWHDFYWFSNGFLSLEWFRYYRYAGYLENKWAPTKTFSSYNRILHDREHRLIVAGHLLKNFKDKSILSCHASDDFVVNKKFNLYQQECVDACDKNIFLNTQNRISDNFAFAIDTKDFEDSFCHVVTERIFYESRIHLTEKVFRPIICCRPFILVSSKGALQYLKNYGFKTFDKYWSEDYDNIDNHAERLDAVLDIMNYIGSLTNAQMLQLLREMQDILVYNRRHFYNEFQNIITNELWSNLAYALNQDNGITVLYDQIIDNLTPNEYEFIANYSDISDILDDNSRDVYYYCINHLIKERPNENIIRPYVRLNAKHFVSFYRGANYKKVNNLR
jgi:hypothetical protein